MTNTIESKQTAREVNVARLFAQTLRLAPLFSATMSAVYLLSKIDDILQSPHLKTVLSLPQFYIASIVITFSIFFNKEIISPMIDGCWPKNTSPDDLII